MDLQALGQLVSKMSPQGQAGAQSIMSQLAQYPSGPQNILQGTITPTPKALPKVQTPAQAGYPTYPVQTQGQAGTSGSPSTLQQLTAALLGLNLASSGVNSITNLLGTGSTLATGLDKLTGGSLSSGLGSAWNALFGGTPSLSSTFPASGSASTIGETGQTAAYLTGDPAASAPAVIPGEGLGGGADAAAGSGAVDAIMPAEQTADLATTLGDVGYDAGALGADAGGAFSSLGAGAGTLGLAAMPLAVVSLARALDPDTSAQTNAKNKAAIQAIYAQNPSVLQAIVNNPMDPSAWQAVQLGGAATGPNWNAIDAMDQSSRDQMMAKLYAAGLPAGSSPSTVPYWFTTRNYAGSDQATQDMNNQGGS